MQHLTTTTRSLEIRGPRRQPWRPVSHDRFQEARHLAEAGRSYEALLAAQDVYIRELGGNLHSVEFRVVTREVTVTVLGLVAPANSLARDIADSQPLTG
jgi:hypothetical protein